MKKTRFVLGMLGILAIALVFGMTLVSCGGDDDPDPFEGTWTSPGDADGTPALKIVAENGSFKYYLVEDNKEAIRGTYTVSGNTVSAKVVEVNTIVFGGADTWYTWENLDSEYKEGVGGETQQFTITNNTLTSGGQTFTKQ